MAKKKLDIVQEEEIVENISVEPLEEIMSSRYATYAKYVIQDRAIPDIRDGLKPVQRRIIYSMFENGDTFDKPTVKCARIVGDVMGKYHPHGDSSIYEALVRMSQDWKIRYPLIEFQGNNGSIDGDGPAAHRYTEARLSELSNELVKNIDKDAVLMQPNYDDKELEPTVLPSRFPNLLINGTEGIAIALATEIPTHNLSEVIDAIIYRIGHKNVTSLDLMNFVHGPDFPLGGIIYKSKGLEDIYVKGKGRIEIAGKCQIVEKKDINQIVITELPYKVGKINLVHEIDLIRASKAINGIIEVRDESDWQGIKIVVDVKKEAKADLVLKYLMNQSSLMTSYSANMVAIDGGKPRTLSLLDYVDSYIAHQISVITNETTFDLNKANARLEIVNGLIIASVNINEVIDVIRKSNDKADAKVNLMDKYNLSKDQAEAIVMMPLYKLSHTDELVLQNEKKTLLSAVAEYQEILSNPAKLNKVLIKDLRTIKSKYGDERRTQIIEKEETKPLDKRDLILAEDVMVAITRDGYIKRSTLKSYRSSGDDILPGMKDGDVLVCRAEASTKDYAVCFTNIGNYICLPIHVIVENKWKDEGVHINGLVNIATGEKIIKVIIINKQRDDLYLAFITKFGQIKRTPLNALELVKKNRPTRCMKVLNNDALVGVELLSGNSDLLVITNNGYASLYNENELNIISMKAGGVKSIMGLGKAYIAGLAAFEENEKGRVLLITDKGHKRILDINKVMRTPRLGKITQIMPVFKSDNHKIISVIKIDKSKDAMKVNLSLNSNESMQLAVDDFSLTDINKYAKKNMSTPAKSTIRDAYNQDVIIINNDIVSHPVTIKEKQADVDEQVEVEESPEEEKKKKTGYEQVSIFDDLD